MQTVLIIVHLIIVLALIGVVLLQRSEGGGLGLGGGGGGGVSGFMTGRGQANALTRATAILGTLFFVTSLILAVSATMGRAPRSILDGVNPTAPAGQQAPGGQGPGILEQLQRQQGEQPGAPAGQAPGAPAAPSIPFTVPGQAPAGAPQVPQSQ
ncbi:MAG TPA: preprotein translocase subunit SecG [Microvirga sp.]